MSDRYTFDHAQLHDLVHGAIELYLEYREQHAKDDADARDHVVREVLEALDSEGELVADGILPAPTLQHAGHADLEAAAGLLLRTVNDTLRHPGRLTVAQYENLEAAAAGVRDALRGSQA